MRDPSSTILPFVIIDTNAIMKKFSIEDLISVAVLSLLCGIVMTCVVYGVVRDYDNKPLSRHLSLIPSGVGVLAFLIMTGIAIVRARKNRMARDDMKTLMYKAIHLHQRKHGEVPSSAAKASTARIIEKIYSAGVPQDLTYGTLVLNVVFTIAGILCLYAHSEGMYKVPLIVAIAPIASSFVMHGLWFVLITRQ